MQRVVRHMGRDQCDRDHNGNTQMTNTKSTNGRAVKSAAKSAPAKSAARAVAPAATVTAPVANGAQSAYIALAASFGLVANGDGLPMRNAFRDQLRKHAHWTNGVSAWGAHNVVTDLHAWCIARAIDRRGDAASPAARKYAADVWSRLPRDIDPAQWDFDIANKRASFRAAPVAKSAPRKRRAA